MKDNRLFYLMIKGVTKQLLLIFDKSLAYYPIMLLMTMTFVFSGCASVKNVPYFQNASDFDGTPRAQLYDMAIKPKDVLTIFVYSGIDAEAVSLFNPLDPRPLEDVDRRAGGIRMQATRGQVHHYLVENDRTIDFPVIGKVKLVGLTVEQANRTIHSLIRPYLNDNTDCVVNTLIENYEITVMGEVKRPNTFTITRNKCTILEALAMAGDMTIYGKRDNVKLLREQPNGGYEIHELDLRDANLLNTPYYYLQQRDILYVEPNEVMAQNAKLGRTRQLWVRGIQITLNLGSLLYRVLN